jgi:signal transduction histidine kinase
MPLLDQLSIKSKLIAIIIFSAVTALVAGFTVIITLNVWSLKQDLVDRTAVMARVVGDYTISAIKFDDKREASDNLRKLASINEVENAFLYDSTNYIFSFYSLHTASANDPDVRVLDTTLIPPEGYAFTNGKLVLYHRLSENGQFVGTICLHLTTEPLKIKIRNYIATMITTGLILSAIAILLALQLQRVISIPLLKLTSLVEHVSREGNYSVRFASRGRDEISILARGFNQMMEQIQQREIERDKAQEALARALREDFRETVKNLQNLIFKVSRRADGDYQFTLFEGKLSTALVSDAVVGKTIEEVFGEETAQRFKANVDRAFEGQSVRFEMLYHRRYYLNALEPIVESGKVREIVGSAVDITRQKASENRLRVSEERYRAVLEGLPVGILQSIRPAGETNVIRLEFVNTEFVRQTGFAMEMFSELSRSDTVSLPLHPDDRSEAERAWQQWLASPAHTTLARSYRMQLRPNEYRWFDDYATKFSIETGDMIVLQALLDVTDKKAAEEQLQQALKKERELNTLKSRFVSTVSHEFRTPLTGILLSVDLLNRYFARLTDKQRTDELEKIRSRVAELTNLMNDFLAQSESESIAGRFKPTPVDIVSICNAVIDDMEVVTASHRRNQHIERRYADAPIMVNGDAKLLTHVFRNLVSNAVKYSRGVSHSDDLMLDVGDNTVVVSIVHDETAVTVDVTDHGIGIPPEDLEHLFTPFFRASNVSKISGTGMGLSIVKEFVHLHDGTITVHSIVGIGSTFTVQLPLLQTTSVPTETESSQPTSESLKDQRSHQASEHDSRQINGKADAVTASQSEELL